MDMKVVQEFIINEELGHFNNRLLTQHPAATPPVLPR